MILGRLIRLLNAPHHSLINVDHLTKTFVTSDIVSFQVQSAGAGLQAGKAEKSQHTGQILVIAALFLQITIFRLFVTVATIFHIRALRQPTQQSRSSVPWQKHMRGLYAASVLILVRNVVRVVQYIQGYGGIHRQPRSVSVRLGRDADVCGHGGSAGNLRAKVVQAGQGEMGSSKE